MVAYCLSYCDADKHFLPRLEAQLKAVHDEHELIAVYDAGLKQENCFAYLQQFWQTVLDSSNAEYFVRLDPDTEVHGRLLLPDWPLAELYHGHLDEKQGVKHVWGCGCLIGRSVAKALLLQPDDSTRFEYFKGQSANLLEAYLLQKAGYESRQLQGNQLRLALQWHPLMLSDCYALTHPCIEKAERKFDVLQPMADWALAYAKAKEVRGFCPSDLRGFSGQHRWLIGPLVAEYLDELIRHSPNAHLMVTD